MNDPISIFEAVKKYGWPKPGSEVKSSEIILGDFCNAKCFFCCAQGSSEWMPLNEVKTHIKKAFKKGCWLISFTGGEAALYPHIVSALSYAKKLKIPMIQIVSNGIAFSNFSFAKKVAFYGANEIKLSLHSVNSERHDRFVGVKGAFKNIMSSIENFNRLRVKVSCNFAVMKENYNELPLFVKFMEKNRLTGFCFMFGFFSGKNSYRGAGISYSRLKPYLLTALNYIKIKKIPIETAMISNFVPCILPGYENIMSDWGDIKSVSSVISDENKKKSNREIYAARKTLIDSCAKCVYVKICYGIEKAYLEKFGDMEFKPLLKIPSKKIYDPLYL
ncbi:MAG: radical SAM protein [Elusimicrobia bacterium]|nr:radical SAM protein [Elusimicrobiota bacterium]